MTTGTGAYVVVELADHDDPTDELTAALADLPEVRDAAVTTEGPARDRLVAFRDRITESISAQGVPLKLDVAVPVGALDELMAAVRAALAAHGGRVVPFGHLAEGNVHVNILEPGDPERADGRRPAAPRRARRHDLGRARRRHRQVAVAAPRALPRRARRRRRAEARPRPRRHPQPRRPHPAADTRPIPIRVSRAIRVLRRGPSAATSDVLGWSGREAAQQVGVEVGVDGVGEEVERLVEHERRAPADEALDDVGILEQAVHRRRQHAAGRPHRTAAGVRPTRIS